MPGRTLPAATPHIRLRAATACLALLFASAAFLTPAIAQTRRKTSTRSANVRTGTLVAVDAGAGTLTLKPATGADIPYRVTDKTHVLRDKKAVELNVFKPGDAVVVRFRKSSVGPATLYDVADRASWDWLDHLRHDTMQVTVRELTDDALRCAQGPDRAEVEYRVTEKTLFGKAGRQASAADFKAGDTVWVAPRLLPSGGLMATAVADSAAGAERLKEHTRSVVSGVVRAISTDRKTLSLHTTAGEDRDLPVAADCVATLSGKDVPLTTLRPGLAVTAHLSRNAEDEPVVSRITVRGKRVSTRRSTMKAARPATKPAAP